MNCNLYQTLGQVSFEEVGHIFRDHLRGCVRQMISKVTASEVSELCGSKHHPTESDHFRAGTGTGSGRVLFQGEREDIIRPRVRKRNADGSSEEIVLDTYRAASDPSQLQDSIVTALMNGVSTRAVNKKGKTELTGCWQIKRIPALAGKLQSPVFMSFPRRACPREGGGKLCAGMTVF